MAWCVCSLVVYINNIIFYFYNVFLLIYTQIKHFFYKTPILYLPDTASRNQQKKIL